MKKSLLACFALFFSAIGFAQNSFSIQSDDKGLYINHTVQPKENFYSVGRLYNAPPKEIAAFNALDMAGGLSVGQTVMIPLTAANFSQTAAGGVPVYYTVGEKEGLYRVSTKNGKVLMADLRKWNKLTSDALNPGQKLIVGFLKAGENTAVAATKPETTPPSTTPEPQANKDSAPAAPQKTEPPAETKPASVVAKQSVPAGGAGYFKNQFDLQSRDQKSSRDATVTSGIFKTSSGWQDAKYYALMDKVEPGTIVQVVNPVNNKSIYAKVLGEMSGIRQNQGLELRISNAAATALDISDPDKFIVRVLY